jgi:transcriptional regulator with XRE-family HTH domain
MDGKAFTMSDMGQQEPSLQQVRRPTDQPIDSRLADTLRMLRKREGLTQRDLALRLNVDHSFISKLERAPGSISITFFRRWCRELREPEYKVMRYAVKVSAQETGE